MRLNAISFIFLFLATSDYSNSPIISSFGAGSSPGNDDCGGVVTFSDRNVENNETFLLELSSSDSATVSNGMAVATITDNDRKFTSILY